LPERSLAEVTRAFTTPESLVLGTSGWSFFSALRKYARFLSPKELLPSPQHNFLQRELFGPSFALPLSYWPAVVDQVGLEPTTLEGTRAFATLQTLAAGIGDSSVFRCSATELRQLSLPAGIEPATVGLSK